MSGRLSEEEDERQRETLAEGLRAWADGTMKLQKENAKLRVLVRRWVDMEPLPETSMLMLESRAALNEETK